MSFDKQAPTWSAPGVEPPQSKKQEGWQVNDKPPAAWLNWFMSLTAESLKELQDKAAEKAWVQEQIAEIDVDIQDASLTQKGITQLSNATNSTSETLAATPKAVKDAYDRGSAGVTAAAAAQAKADAAETPAGAQAKANAAETNAKGYADTNFYKRSQFATANLVKNSSGFFGLQNWTNKGSGTWRSWDNTRYGSSISFDEAAATGDWKFLDSDPIGVIAGGTYTFSIDFHTSGTTAADAIFAEIKAPAGSNTNAAVLRADANKWWHTKSITFTVPTGVTTIAVRLVVHNKPAGVSAGFSRITLTETTNIQPYSLEGDIKALFQSVANGKQAIATAISDKGVAASGSDEFAVLANKIGQIKTGLKFANGGLGNSYYGTISNLPFTPKALFIGVYAQKPGLTASGYAGAILQGSTIVLNGGISASSDSQSIDVRLTDLIFGSNSVSFSLTDSTSQARSYIVFGE